MKRAEAPAQDLPSTTCFPANDLPAIRWRWCSSRTGSTTARCRPSPASSTCPRRCSSCRRRTRRIAPMCASSRRCTNCRSPGTRQSARRSPSPRRPAATTPSIFVLEEKVGPVRCAVSSGAGRHVRRIRPAAAARAGRILRPIRRRSPHRSASIRTRSASRITSCLPIPAACPTSWCRSPGLPRPPRPISTRAPGWR